jgi:hypothetical protein
MVAHAESDLDALFPSPPLPPDEAETIPAREQADMRGIVTDIRAMVRSRYEQARSGKAPPSPSGQKAVRDAHPKILGCCKATLRVPADLPLHLAHGIFAPGASYRAWVRFSNGADQIQSDREKDGRGIAIKVCGVPPERGDRLPGGDGAESTTQDFNLIDHPVFFVRDTRDYVQFVHDKRTGKSGLRFFFPGLTGWRLRELVNAIRVKKRPDNVLGQRFFSMTPFRLGPHVVKIAARPLGPAQSPPAGTADADALRASLSAQLQAGPARFAIEIQRQRPGMSVEDATQLWCEDDAPFEKVAELVIPAQKPDTAERLLFGDRLSFSPWHGLSAHRPLGSLNRLRRAVYAAIAAERRALNGDAPPFEPTGEEP